MKKHILLSIALLLIFPLAAQKKSEAQTVTDTTSKGASSINVIASTSWTAAFADLAGIDNATPIAPATLRHPPEYEITVSDIQKISESDFFIYAGFERMMKTLGKTCGKTQMIQIALNNSLATIEESSQKIAEACGTMEERNKRLAEYKDFLQNARAELKQKGLTKAKVIVNKNQIYLAQDLGLDIIAVFGPGEVTASQIQNAKNSSCDFIIDNVHNPVGSPLAEASPTSKYILWRNFPETTEHNALLHTIQGNVDALRK